MRILLAEDEHDILAQYSLALQGNNHQVVTTSDGEECLRVYMAEMHKNAPFDAVVLDHRMPKMDGLEVARHILAVYPRQRIILASAYAKESLVDSVKQLKGVVELLQKPFDLEMLVDMVEDTEIYGQLEKLNVKRYQ